jgi:hypothetical protein
MIGDAGQVASSSGYNETIYKDLTSLGNKVKNDEQNLFEKNSEELTEDLTVEIIGRFRGDSAQTEASLRYDRQAMVAESILENSSTYKRFLAQNY